MQSELPPSTESTPGVSNIRVESKGVWANFSHAQKIVASVGLLILMLPIIGSTAFVAVMGVKNWQALGDSAAKLGIFTLVILGIFFAVAKAKSRSAAWASVITLLVLSTCFSGLVVSGVVWAVRSRSQAEASKKLSDTLSQIADRAEKASKSDTVDPQATRQNAALAASAATDIFKSESPEMQAAVRAVTERATALGESVATYQESVRPFLDAGGIDAATLTTLGTARQRRAMLEGPRTRLRLLNQLSADFNKSAIAAARATGARGEVLEAFLGGLSKSPIAPLRNENFKIEGLLIENYDDTLSILETYDGQWKIDASGKILFDADIPDQAVAKYNALSKTRTQLVDRQTAVQAQIVEVARNKARQTSR